MASWHFRVSVPNFWKGDNEASAIQDIFEVEARLLIPENRIQKKWMLVKISQVVLSWCSFENTCNVYWDDDYKTKLAFNGKYIHQRCDITGWLWNVAFEWWLSWNWGLWLPLGVQFPYIIHSLIFIILNLPYLLKQSCGFPWGNECIKMNCLIYKYPGKIW